MTDFEDVVLALENAIELCSPDEVEAAIVRLADDIVEKLADTNPLVVCVLNGGVVFTGQILPLLNFPLELDYLHASRYRQKTTGTEIKWIAHPQQSMKGRTVLILDDIFDEGFTLDAVVDHCRKAGAQSVYSAVLVKKQHQRERAELEPDFIGLTTSDMYLFGAGMDYRGYWRNLPGIYGLKV